MQSSSRSRPFKSGLIGASPITDAKWPNASCPRSSDRSQSGTLRRCRPQVQLLPRTPFSPLCLSSNRASFVNSYSSVRVRPGAPSGLWCNSSISAREADGPGANPGFLTIFNNLRVHVSPVTVMTMVRCRGLTSHSKWKTCCHVPKTKFPSLMGTVSDGPSIVACKCEWPLPSCQACSWP